MQSYPVDIDPEQIVRWVMAEHRAAPSKLKTSARRTTEMRDIPLRQEFHLGDGEREDLSEVATVATLEIAPADTKDGWRLTVVVEDEAGPRLAEGGASTESEQAIDLGTFYKEFIRPGRGSSNVVAEVADSVAKGRMTRLLGRIERNIHASSPAASAR